jgi:hypothetical protein
MLGMPRLGLSARIGRKTHPCHHFPLFPEIYGEAKHLQQKRAQLPIQQCKHGGTKKYDTCQHGQKKSFIQFEGIGFSNNATDKMIMNCERIIQMTKAW